MIRPTSKAALRDLRESKKIGRRQQQVIDFVALHPGCTRGEIARTVKDFPINCVSGRVRELLDAEVLTEHGCMKDPVTGQSVNRLYLAEKGEGVA